MQRSEYLESIAENFYRGEVFGEAIFSGYYALEEVEARKRKWAVLLQLETETKARLRPFILQLGLTLEEGNPEAAVAGYLESFKNKSWTMHMEEMASLTEHFLEKFRAIEAIATGYERQMAHIMVRHEEAIHAFARAELRGEHETSLDDVIHQLHWPIH